MSDWSQKNVIEDSYVLPHELNVEVEDEWEESHRQLDIKIQLVSLRDSLHILNLLQGINDDVTITEANRKKQIDQELKNFWRRNPSFRTK